MLSLRDIAKTVDLSVATVSRALRNDPSVQKRTVIRVKKAARKMGYQANPLVGTFMSSMRRRQGSAFRGSLALLWVDFSPPNAKHPDMLPIRLAARKRANELGYALDEFALMEFGPLKLLRILNSRNIQGILISPSYQTHGRIHLRFSLDSFSAVGMGWGTAYPVLSSVRLDHYQAMSLAMHHARRGSETGVAALCDSDGLRRSSYVTRASFLANHPAGPAAAENLFFESRNLKQEKVQALLLRHKVRTLIAQRDSACPPWLQALVPEAQTIYLEKPQYPQQCHGWIDQHYSLIGQWGIEMLIGLVQRGEKGPPLTPQIVLVPGNWVASI